MVICLERGANDLYMVQLMPLPPHHLLLQQNPERFILLVLAYPGCPGKKAAKRLCVCVFLCMLNLSVVATVIKHRVLAYLLIKELFNLQWLDDVGDELRVDVGIADALMQQLPYRALRLGTDLLWLVAHIQIRSFCCNRRNNIPSCHTMLTQTQHHTVMPYDTHHKHYLQSI